MSLMNAVVSQFAEREDLYPAPPNEHLRAAVESRQEKDRWSRHWSSG